MAQCPFPKYAPVYDIYNMQLLKTRSRKLVKF